ncbi:hypothetical protein ITP53_09550 [Nonomuraea sp. K274]|uniref:Uncharacterized protein n=1 Tax=Nonomuraea cypriaca TaxID=1187855 RepID=A0A931A6N2_9ACTN|nr:hypothetical protein [Nonomuraea cypriaca]MBF8185985.1 hypothetical protein [Nonomuraea cypriaca]
MQPGKNQAGALAKLLDRGSAYINFEDEIAHYASALQSGLGAEDAPSVIQFLRSLKISTTSGDEIGMRAFVIEEVARPILLRLGIQPALARAAYNAAFSLVEDAVQGLDPEVPNPIWASSENLLEVERGHRTLTRDRLIRALVDAGLPITSDTDTGGRLAISAMSRKLRAGCVGPTVTKSAPRLRRDWFEVEAAYRADVPTRFNDEVRRIRSEVANRAGIAESTTRMPGQTYGMKMHSELSKLLSDSGFKPNLPVGPPELMGCAYQLTDECEVWWSDEFNPSGEAPWTLVQAPPEQLALLPEDFNSANGKDNSL